MRGLRARLCVVLFVLGAVCPVGVGIGQVTLDADFDHGSLDLANSDVSGTFVTLAGRDNHNPGQWKWIYFSADGVNGQQVLFEIGDNFVTGGSSLEQHAMVYSYDQENWEFFDTNVRNSAAGNFRFANTTPFTQDRVYVAYGLPYSLGRSEAHTAQMAGSPWVSPTLSGNADLVIGQSPGGIDDLGRTIASSDMVGYQLTDPSIAHPKTKIALVGGVHANETLGNHTLEGLLNFLAGDDLEAALLRRRAEFYVYPMANPDGRFAGYNRSTVEFVNFDPNRHWEPFASPPYDGQTDIQVVGDALIADTGGDVDYFVDFHSTVASKDGHFAYIPPDAQNDPFWLNVLQLDPSLRTLNSSLVNFTAAKFGRDVLGAEFTSTFETEFLAGENIDRFHALGETLGLAWYQHLHVTGDLNFDGALDATDWPLFIAGAETNLSGLTALEAYEAGDLNGDGFNDVFDFLLFKQEFDRINGAGAFSAMLANIPEPHAACLQLLGCLLLASLRHRQRQH